MPLVARTEQNRRDAMLNIMNLSGVTLRDFTFAEHKPSYTTPHIDVTMQFESRKLANITGSRMFIPVGLFHEVTVPRALQQRVQPVSINYGYVDIDTVVVTIPQGYVIEALPQTINEVTPLGEVEQTSQANDNTITIVTRHMMRDGRYPATEYATLRNIMTAAKRANDQRIVLRKEK